MKLNCVLLLVLSVVFLSFKVQRNPLHKKWKLVAEEITYFNFDYTRYDKSRDRLDSIKNETVSFLPNGSFKSSEGEGTYTVNKDSVYLYLNGKIRPLKYELNNSKLILQNDYKESRFIERSKLYLE